MKSTNLVVGLLAASQQAAAVIDKWTPETYDWNSHVGRYGVATTNVSARPMTKEFVGFASQTQNLSADGLVVHQAFAIPISIGVALRAATWLGSAVGLVSTGVGCYEVIKDAAGGEQVSDESKTSCITGAAAGLIGFGAGKATSYFAQKSAAAAAARALAPPPSIPIPELGQDFRQAMELTRFGGNARRHIAKRSLQGRVLSAEQEWDQYFHDEFTANMIRDANVGEWEFLGYADDGHQLSRRDGVHPLAPRFKFDHHKRGPVVLSTMFSNKTAHITLEPWIEDNPAIHKRWQEEYRKEILEEKRIVEGRFDHEAANADPGDVAIDEEQMFEIAEDSIHCALGGEPWPLDHVIDVQMYDDANKATFGYASVGIFDDHTHDSDLEGMDPQPPVSGGQDC